MGRYTAVADEDEVMENLADIRNGLDIKFDDTASVQTLGEVFDMVWDKVASQVTPGGRCPTTTSYFLVRRLIQDRGSNQKLTPSTRLKDIKGFQYSTVQNALQRDGWTAPVRYLTFETLCLALMIATVGTWLAGLSNGFAVVLLWFGLLWVMAWASHRWLFRRGMPDRCKTLGDLAQCLARQNLKRLRAEGATGLNRAIVYRMLVQGVGSADPSAVLTWD